MFNSSVLLQKNGLLESCVDDDFSTKVLFRRLNGCSADAVGRTELGG